MSSHQVNGICEVEKPTKADSIFTFGVIADVQYADVDDGHSYDVTRKRYYRSALVGLQKAIRVISDYGEHRGGNQEGQLETSFLLQLGDLIDGRCKGLGKSKESLETIGTILECYKRPIYHMVGNHELYNFTKQELQQSYLFNDLIHPTQNAIAPQFWHDTAIHDGFRLVVLDCYDITVLGIKGEKSTDKDYRHAEKLLRAENHNEDWNSHEELPEGRRHFTAYNGMVNKPQLDWLDHTLQKAETNGEKVIMAGHIPIHPPHPWYNSLVWNHNEVLDVIHRYSCVIAYFSGHDHDGRYLRDEHGVHHITIQAILETPPGGLACGIVHVCRDKLLIEGFGRVPSYTLEY